MKTETRNLVSYYALSEEWQAEARSNNEDSYEVGSYIEPLEGQTPKEHYLLDLSTCMRWDDGEYDGIIGISNTSAIAVVLNDFEETVTLTYL